jgi:hypothetical protein
LRPLGIEIQIASNRDKLTSKCLPGSPDAPHLRGVKFLA